MRLIASYSKKLNCQYSIFISFPYHPLYVNLIKSMPNRAWIVDEKIWELGMESKDAFLSLLSQYNISYNQQEFEDSIQELASPIQKTNHQINIDELKNIDWGKTIPRNYQLEGIAFGLQNDRFLLADEQGCGKTMQVLNISSLKKTGKHCLIICGYNSLKFNWIAEIEKHTNEKGHVLGVYESKRGKKLKMGSLEERFEDLQREHEEFFLITDIVTLRYCLKNKYKDSNGKNRISKDYIFAKKVNELCQKGIIGRVILDESQVCKNFDSDQTKALLNIKHCNYKIAATGTPLMNNHIDLYPIMTWLGYETKNYWQFRDAYCVMGGYQNKEVKGNKNSSELNQRLGKFMLRRKKSDVLDLPEKIYIDEYLEMDLKQKSLYDSILKHLKSQLVRARGNKTAMMSLMLKLRQVTAFPGWLDPAYKESVKFERVHFLMDEIVQNNKKAIIFSNWTTPIYALYEELKQYNPVMITGDTKDLQRMQNVEKFQTDNNCKLIMGSIGSMGTGLTLTAAENVIFIDEPWNRALKDQATDRAHRIGTINNVNVYTLLCRNTFDETVHKIVQRKGSLQDQVVDGISIEILNEMADAIINS